MIPGTSNSKKPEPADWRRLWRDAVTDPLELLDLLGLTDLAADLADAGLAAFPLRVPRGYVAKMRRGDRHDPLLRQVLPLNAEDRPVPGFNLDAVGDAAAKAGDGVLHKYQGRALLIATGSCAIHCRYCFRRHFPYADETAAKDHWRPALSYLRDRTDIDEVLLSGGDPLSLSNAKLASLYEALAELPSIRRIRIHTRLPIVLPERIDSGLLQLFRNSPKTQVMVIHANHAQELDAPVGQALSDLRQAGVQLLNQSVLLRGVNDRLESLSELSERLIELGVLPYYLHLLDRVAGTAHFEVDATEAAALERGLRNSLPGYLVPKFVREIAGEPAKTPAFQP
ncbi:EF-P beta-lysylation protein EpmB [Ahniella affigens]|uniref:L-lysine 2,3-aminomutase n=1 Tax=Ahniella affigens TaxID=2021234 RepID=A0A2P1PTC6_9GAMM|nr:EF-P beta-lysylation protein EpmB [Ahniella affigens]AVP98091.1 EF-P beta-lysylation protein EpmB [Ahniella affigens]